MIHVLLCGGFGSRLWPLSRELQPKQFIHLFDNQSLFQKTILGNQPLVTETIVVCHLDHQFLAQQQCEAHGYMPKTYILEPAAKNTSAAIALALLTLSAEDIVLITPSDHHIEYSNLYSKTIEQAKFLAEKGHIVVFGIVPHTPETGYGYIEANGENVVKFHEKPHLELAIQYVSQQHYYWNSGMVCCQVKKLLDTIKCFAPEIFQLSTRALDHAARESTTSHIIKIAPEDMDLIPSLSIDYAVLEKTSDLKMVKCEFRWSDLGSFDSLFFQLQKDSDGNALEVKSFYGVNAKNNLMICEDRIVTAIDVEDLIVVDTKDALLISKLGSTQKVKEIVNLLKLSGSLAHKTHIDEVRRWGHFAVLESGNKYKVKQLVIRPAKKISLQKHQHRHEHWTIVAGSGKLTIGNHERLIQPNQSVFIEAGEIHRIENIGQEDLIVIEVQYGDYIDENDILRIGEEGLIGLQHSDLKT